EAVERLPDAIPLGLDDAPADPGLENRARQVLEEERGISRCVVAELLEWRGQLAHPRPQRRLLGRGRVPGPYLRDERRRLVVREDGEPQCAVGVLQPA